MSRRTRDERRPEASFPRVSGDEPLVDEYGNGVEPFSPRERG